MLISKWPITAKVRTHKQTKNHKLLYICNFNGTMYLCGYIVLFKLFSFILPDFNWIWFYFLETNWYSRIISPWPANNCLQIMVFSCPMRSNCVLLQIIFFSCIKETVLFSFLQSLLRENDRLLRFPRIFIKKKTNSVIKW